MNLLIFRKFVLRNDDPIYLEMKKEEEEKDLRREIQHPKKEIDSPRK